MFPNNWRERLPLAATGLILLGGLVYAGARYSRTKAAIEIESAAPSSAPIAAHAGPRTSAEIRVDVEGAVMKPGLITLPADARVDDAIRAAGGRTKDADTELVNLAAKLSDGTQVYVPRKGHAGSTAVSELYQGGPDSPSAYTAQPPETAAVARGGHKSLSSPISLNTATEAQLQSLPGVGPSTAKKIVDYRKEHGGFKSVDEILSVKGFGQKKLDALRKWLRV